MKKLSFIQIEKGNQYHYDLAEKLWIPFSEELNEHEGITETKEEIIHDLTRRINIQGSRVNMHFELALKDDTPVGIAMFAIDTGTVYGLLESGYGVITGFYICPEYRRKGYGKSFFEHIETVLINDGAPKIYLTPDGVTGEPFWVSLGFENSGKFDPDDKKYIYIKDCKGTYTNNKINFVQINNDNSSVFIELMKTYAGELDKHQGRNTNPEMLKKWTESIIKKQFDNGRCLKLCCYKSEVIGFLYGKIDKSDDKGFKKVGYGCIMEFYVIPEYRRKGFGKSMYLHIENFFRENDVKRMYLTADPVTGKPFWEAMGFISQGEFSPDNGQEIFEKAVPSDIITITVSEFLTEDLAKKIALAQWNNSDWAGNIMRVFYGHKSETDCFNVVAENAEGVVVGRLLCIQNDINPSLWYYGDLYVIPECRCRNIALRMLKAAIKTIEDKGGTTLRCYVEADNHISVSLQKKLGFEQKPYQAFNELVNDGQLMLEKELAPYRVEKAELCEAVYITMLYGKNVEALHGTQIRYNEWCEILSVKDEDEVHFLIYRGAMPVAWLKINGLSDEDTCWISMLAVEPKFQRQGIGKFAVSFAEDYCRSLGKKQLFVKTTADNTAAQKLYSRRGFAVCDEVIYSTGDGISRAGIVYSKMIV